MGQNNVNTTPASKVEEAVAQDQQHVWHHSGST